MSQLPEIPHGEFADQLHDGRARLPDQRIPTDGMLELTRLCSLKCTHCYIGDARWKKDPSELSTAEVKALLDVLAERGTLWLTFTGGEPTLRKDFRELWLYARSKGFLLTLYTNATLIDESLADFLAQHPPMRIEVSIYGVTPETYERVSLVPGSYRRFRSGIERIRTRGLPWLLKATTIEDNAHELARMEELAREWGVEFRFDGAINASIGTGRSAGQAPCATRLSEEEFAEIELRDPLTRQELKAMARFRENEAKTTPAQAPTPPAPEPLYTCGAGSNMFYVTSRGELQMCVLTGHHGGRLSARAADAAGSVAATEIIARNFDDIWGRFGEVRRIQRKPDSPCLSCDISALCKSCPGFAQLETGDEHDAVAWLCRSTHLKAWKMNLPHKCDIRHFVYSPPQKRV